MEPSIVTLVMGLNSLLANLNHHLRWCNPRMRTLLSDEMIVIFEVEWRWIFLAAVRMVDLPLGLQMDFLLESL